jgi:hypothetical protein
MKRSERKRTVGGRKGRWPLTAGIATLMLIAMQAFPAVATAAGVSIVSATFGGGAGTAVVSGTFFAKSGAALTLTVVTDTGTNCVTLSGAHTGTAGSPTTSDSTSKTWQFAATALTGADGVRTTTVSASADPGCATSDATSTAAYTVDNTGPTVTAVLSPAPNGFGWNTSNVTISWSATDAGSGVATGPTPAADSQTVETGGAVKISTATDRVGNVRNASTSVKLDKTAPSISGSRNPVANANGWNNTNVTVSFSCSDGRSGVRTCTGPTSFTSNVSGQSVVGSAFDFAGLTSSTTVVVNVDKNAPTISGAPVGAPNSDGWYHAPVSVVWTCTDTGGSGFAPNACANSTISSEGTGLTATKSVSDLADNPSSTATSSPAVNIDLTAPITTATPSFTGAWSSSDVTVGLAATDSLSGVASTHFKVDGGSDQTYGAGNVPTLSADGSHTLEYWSFDVAGNEEVHHTWSVGVDKTAPSVVTSQSPTANFNGWNNSPVVVSFSCSDSTSGIATCPANVNVTGEGANQPVSGTAFDLAGNSSSASKSVSIDLTSPTVNGSVSPSANAFGWNNTSVVVSYSCSDALSGVASCASPTTISGEGAGQSASDSAFDLAGNSATASVTGINIDETGPAVSVAGVVSGGTYDAGSFTASCVTTDGLSGVDSQAVLSTTGGPTGPLTITCTGASDRAGNQQAGPVSVMITVRPKVAAYQFGGFQRPIDGGVPNTVNAGQAVPVKFSLRGYRGMGIFMAGFPASAAYPCGTTPPSTATEALATNGSLTYDPSSDRYSLVWKTQKAWTGCRVLQLSFTDGSVARAYFSFK